MKKYAVGVDIGGTTVKLGIFNIDGSLISKFEIPTRKENGGKLILGDIAKALDDYFLKNDIDKSLIAGVGMGVPGPVKEDGVVVKCVNLGWGIFNVEEELSKLLNLKVKAANDANIAALGEMWQGGGKGHQNVVMVTLGTGVGGGVIIDGKIISGNNGAAGEIGHIKVEKNESRTCGCGNKGCLEQYASATGIVNSAKEYLKNNSKSSVLRNLKEITSKDIFDVAKNNDEVALHLVEGFGEKLGTALAMISCVCDPEVFVIGGGVSKAGDLLINVINKYYKEAAFHASRETKFELAKLGNDAGIFGGAKLAQDIK